MSNIEFELIDALFVRYKKFRSKDLEDLLRCRNSKIRKLTSSYSRAYEEKYGEKPYNIVTVGHYAYNNGSRHFAAKDSFRPLALYKNDIEPDQLASNILLSISTLNGVKLGETTVDKINTILTGVMPVASARTDQHFEAFCLIDILLVSRGQFDQCDIKDYLNLKSHKAADYIIKLYRKEAKIDVKKAESVYVAGEEWKPVCLTNEVNEWSFMQEIVKKYHV